jgi:hypothetical protein
MAAMMVAAMNIQMASIGEPPFADRDANYEGLRRRRALH